jgi:hypothetical protein
VARPAGAQARQHEVELQRAVGEAARGGLAAVAEHDGLGHKQRQSVAVAAQNAIRVVGLERVRQAPAGEAAAAREQSQAHGVFFGRQRQRGRGAHHREVIAKTYEGLQGRREVFGVAVHDTRARRQFDRRGGRRWARLHFAREQRGEIDGHWPFGTIRSLRQQPQAVDRSLDALHTFEGRADLVAAVAFHLRIKARAQQLQVA